MTSGRQVVDVLEVLDGGLQATIQDAGRRGHEAEGVPRSGAADPIGLAVANLLLGNDPDAAAVEATLIGLRLRAIVDVDVAIGGADLGATVDGAALPPGRAVRLGAGSLLELGGSADAIDATGCRAYVAVPGGVDVPVILDSRSTCLPAGFGGIDGRPLRAGDRIAAAGGAMGRHVVPAALPARLASDVPTPAQRLRVLPGPASSDDDPVFARLVDRHWTVSATSDRRGLRLEAGASTQPGATGPAAAGTAGGELAPRGAGELPSLGVLPGAIQVTPSGEPLVLMPDAGTTGGYPVVAVVIDADRPLLGQLGPGAEVRFRRTTLAAAREAAIDRRRFLADLAARLS